MWAVYGAGKNSSFYPPCMQMSREKIAPQKSSWKYHRSGFQNNINQTLIRIQIFGYVFYIIHNIYCLIFWHFKNALML